MESPGPGETDEPCEALIGQEYLEHFLVSGTSCGVNTASLAGKKVMPQRKGELPLHASILSLVVLVLFVCPPHSKISMKLEVLGAVSPPSSITYLDGGAAFIGSHYGDSQVSQIFL